MTTDRYGNRWPDSFDVCPECGQPDNCGDCNHAPLTPEQVVWVGGRTARLAELPAACGYSDGTDGDETGIDSLIAYKDALEDAYEIDAAALDTLNLMLSAPEWPGASGMEDVLEVVRRTGRVEVPDAPEWRGH